MATKPIDTVPDWPSNAVYVAGPSVGLATTVDPTPFAGDGHIEGVANPTCARVQNGWQKRAGNWCRWVESGSSAGAANAHIVEADSNGYTSVAMLEVLGNGALGPASLEVTRQGSTPQAVLVTSGASSISMGTSASAQVSVSAATDLNGVESIVTGNAVPIRLAPQLVEPVLNAGDNGGIGFKYNSSLGSPEPTRMHVVTGGSKRYVALYSSEFSKIEDFAAGPFVFNGDISARTTTAGPVGFDQWQAPQTGGNTYNYSISFEYSSPSSTADMWVALYNNAVLVRRFFMSLHGEVTIQQGNVRGRLNGAALLADSFTVEVYKVVGGGSNVTVNNVILTIEPTQ